MYQPLVGKIALVTGSSQGIGRQIAETLAARGAHVIVNYPYVSEASSAATVVAAIAAGGGSAVAVCADVTRIAEIRALFKQAIERFGAIDIVVSNAGGASVFKPIAEASEEDYDRTMALNAKANFFVLQEAAKTVRDNGRIVVIASTTVDLAFAGSAIYAGAKAAAATYARVLAKELGPRGITVNAVSPGLVDTVSMRAAGQVEERFAMAQRMTPLGRIGRPDDIADVIAFVVSEGARWVTAQNLRVGGGVV
jgi:3-oxoacyl-[acyl-carrier protein] reductase